MVSYIDIEDGFEDEKRRWRQRSLIWGSENQLISLSNEEPLCINPLTWTNTQDPIPRDQNIGAASATGLMLGEKPPAISGATGAQCVNGILEIESPRQSFLRRNHWFGDHWKAQNFNLFYHDLLIDARRRLDIHLSSPLNEQSSHNSEVESPFNAVNKTEDE